MRKSIVAKTIVGIITIAIVLVVIFQGSVFVIADPNGTPGDNQGIDPLSQLISDLCDPNGPPGDDHSFDPAGLSRSDLCDPNGPPGDGY